MNAEPPSLAAIPVLPEAPLLLTYAPVPRNFRRERWTKIALLASILPGLVAPFVAFTNGVTPLAAARATFGTGSWISGYIIGCLGLSFFITYPLTLWRVRQMLKWPVGKSDFVATMVMATICWVPILVILFNAVPEMVAEIARPFGKHHLLNLAASLLLLSGVTTAALIAFRIRKFAPSAAVEALFIGPYLSNAAFLLLAFYEDRSIGYWLTAVTAGILSTQLLSLPSRAKRCVHVL